MSDTKIRHQFLLDPITSEQLNALARSPGATKTDIIAEAIKAFLERGSESEFAQLSALRLDKIGRDLETIRQELDTVRHEVDTIREGLAGFAHYGFLLSAGVPSPDEKLHDIGQKRFLKFVTHVGELMARGTSSFVPKKEGNGA